MILLSVILIVLSCVCYILQNKNMHILKAPAVPLLNVAKMCPGLSQKR